jgi:hypothetical protein
MRDQISRRLGPQRRQRRTRNEEPLHIGEVLEELLAKYVRRRQPIGRVVVLEAAEDALNAHSIVALPSK